ncbi:membrane-bound alkaline phosphatase-like [Eupeodes corollae]|uniref:membrane-bound alkaline phosphatase-like n=1 Tax=Eupeodes corollae TaxID=290404 RepID=UPI0024927445|nr:membrane-bound alkaline phosphatase-like [Eupeodes corollae]
MQTRFKVFAVLAAFAAIIAIAGAEKMHPRLSPRKGTVEIKYPEELNTKYWVDKAQSILADKLKNSALNKNRAKNIIMFLGDGMSVHTVTATRAFMGDSSKQISFEKFPYLGLSKTYCVDKQVADSACSATAYLSGVKGNYGTIGVNAQVKRRDCNKAQDPSTHTESIAKWAQDAGKSTGLVTTARVTHASPAGVYAHIADRSWESDTDIIKDKCSAVDNLDIARQLVHTPVGRNLKVIMGGGRREFRGKHKNDEEGLKGRRTDGRDLIEEWITDKKIQDAEASYVWSRKGLNELDLSKTEYLLGLFSSNHCPYHGDLARKGLEKSDPSLSEMTEAAIKVLKKNKKGYFLFVEGARIDMAHHENWARKALEDTKEFANAVELARNITSEKDTLIVVTSDHSHTMTINGYPFRSQDILGVSDKNADDNLPYTVLSYANGPGFYNTYSKEEGRRDVSLDDFNDPTYAYLATAPLDSETHGGDDVAIFTSGPYAHTFTGNYEQTNIPALMAYAADIGPFQDNQLTMSKTNIGHE